MAEEHANEMLSPFRCGRAAGVDWTLGGGDVVAGGNGGNPAPMISGDIFCSNDGKNHPRLLPAKPKASPLAPTRPDKELP